MNNSLVNLLYVLAFYSPTVDARLSFKALTDIQWYVNELYPREWNEDGNSDVDPATADASARLQICDDITQNGVFILYDMKPVKMEEVYDELMHPKYADIFHRIYSLSEGSDTSHHHSYTYTNPYTPQEFLVEKYPADPEAPYISRKEYVFVCLLRNDMELSSSDSDSCDDLPPIKTHSSERAEEELKNLTRVNSLEGFLDDIFPVYVTRAYGAKKGFHAHRYIHLDVGQFDGDDLMLAEISAEAYSRPDFNIELHYLELRKHHQPAPSIEDDPILQFAQSSVELHRICATVTSSSFFEEKMERMGRVYNTRLLQREVSFRTDEGKREVGRKQFQELMMSCVIVMPGGRISEVFISRAYNPFQVFVYLEDPLSYEVHLEWLAMDVSLAQDRHNLGHVEI